MKIVILDGYVNTADGISMSCLDGFAEVIYYDYTPVNDNVEIIKRIGDAECIMTNKTPIVREVIENCPNLKFISELATGYNNIDIEAAREHGVSVANVPTYGTDAVAQFAIALLLEICNRVGHHDRAVQEGRWQKSAYFCFWDYPLIELANKTMGVIGFGRIGQTTGRIAKALGMNVIACDSYPSDAGREIGRYVTLDELYAQADVISLHCPLLPETSGMVDKTAIAKMKDGVIILNNSRGPLIAEQDLADALNCGKVLAAGVDVVSTEPITDDNPLLKAKNCIITPHISWVPKETRQRMMDVAVANIIKYFEGTPQNIVNPPK